MLVEQDQIVHIMEHQIVIKVVVVGNMFLYMIQMESYYLI